MAGRRSKHSYTAELFSSIQEAASSFVHQYSGGTNEETLDGRQQVLAMALTQKVTNELAEQILVDLGDDVPVERAERAAFVVAAQTKAKQTFQTVLSDNHMVATETGESWVLLAKQFMSTLDGLVEELVVAASHVDAARCLTATALQPEPVTSSLDPTTKLLADLMEKVVDQVTAKPKGEVNKHLAEALRYKKALHDTSNSRGTKVPH